MSTNADRGPLILLNPPHLLAGTRKDWTGTLQTPSNNVLEELTPIPQAAWDMTSCTVGLEMIDLTHKLES